MEEWKDIPGYEGKYQVSNLGNVKSLNYNRTGKEKILKPGKNTDNYLFVDLCKNGKEKKYLVHRIVAEAFIPKIEEKTHVDHIDGNRQNNVYTNLRWCTPKENSNFELCKKHISEANGKKVLCIELDKLFGSTMEAERETGINQQSISMCCRGKLKSAGKHPVTGERLHWKYIDINK